MYQILAKPIKNSPDVAPGRVFNKSTPKFFSSMRTGKSEKVNIDINVGGF